MCCEDTREVRQRVGGSTAPFLVALIQPLEAQPVHAPSGRGPSPLSTEPSISLLKGTQRPLLRVFLQDRASYPGLYPSQRGGDAERESVCACMCVTHTCIGRRASAGGAERAGLSTLPVGAILLLHCNHEVT